MEGWMHDMFRRQISRRSALARGGAAAVAVTALGGVAGCGTLGSKPGATTQKPRTIIALRAWGYGSGAAGSEATINGLLHSATATWRAKHPGVDVQIVPNTGGPGQVVAEILAGTGPDIYHSWHPDVIFATDGLTVDLSPYLRKSNANLSAFNKAQMSLFQLPSGVRALPCYLGTMALAVNETLLDSLGLTYPQPGWTYKEYGQLATEISRSHQGKSQVYGGAFGLGNLGAPNGFLPPNCILEGFGGSYVAAGNPTKCNLDAPGSVEAIKWIYGLAQSKAITSPNGGGRFSQGTLGMTWAPSFFLPQAATNWNSLKWHYYDMPSFPQTGPVTGATSDLYAMNPASKNPDLAWSLLEWLSFEPEWQRKMIRIFLLSPALVSLWEEWVTLVPQYAPPLANKNLKAFATLAQNNHAYPQQFMRWQADQAYTLMNTWGQKMWSRQIGVTGGLSSMVKQIDALELSGASAANALTKVQRELKTVPKTGHYPAPPKKGAGDPYHLAPSYMQVDKHGVYTLLGDGYDVYLAQDACTFFCLPQTAADGRWTCRVTTITNLTCPQLSSWAKVGLMARGDLSDDAPMVSTHVTGGNAIEWQDRALPGMTPGGQGGLAPTGLKGAMVKPLGTPTPNFLSQPIWLRLERSQAVWTAFSSLDGKKWNQTGQPSRAEMGATWVGLMCTSHNSDFKDKGYIRARLDHVSFTPTMKVQLGVTGVPPASGPVPANWATMPPQGVTTAPKATASKTKASAKKG